MKQHLNQIYSGFLGMNIGIRLGAPVEPSMWTYERIERTYGDIRGYVSLRELNATDARIGLLAGRGAGAELMQTALNWAYARGKTTLRVATQMGNTAALKRYIQSGANVESTAYWLYR